MTGTSGTPGDPAPAPGAVIGVGTDLVDIPRFEEVLGRRPRMADRLFSDAELSYARGLARPAQALAGRFAVKEAVMKALGVGLGSVDWPDISVVRLPGGRPQLDVAGRAAELAGRLGVGAWHVSISHTGTVAAAVVVAVA